MRVRLLLFAFLIACMGGRNGAGPRIGAAVPIVPSSGLPPEVAVGAANNNLDVVRYGDRVFLAFRTAPHHFASADAALYVVSSTDEKSWTLEHKIALGTDVREPRFLVLGGRLLLYFAELGSNPLSFEPRGIRMVERRGPGAWSDPVRVYEDDFIAWRTKVVDGRAYMVGYKGGQNLYNGSRAGMEIHWLTTDDGSRFRPVVPGKPVVETGGGSETDFVFVDGGAVLAVTRDEAGDAAGWGSKICRAEAGALADWRCVVDPKKYDSPLLFRRGADVYLIARRNLTASGDFDLHLRDMPAEHQTGAYLMAYSTAPKRCSLWKVDPATLTVGFVADLPSKGDTCFPGILDGPSPDQVIVYNYSSDLAVPGDDKWIAAQLRPTRIYRTEITF